MIRRYEPADREKLVTAINQVCAEGMMATPHFQPTPAWLHALARPHDAGHLLLVAEEVREIVGWCRLFSTGPGQVELGIGLLPAYRGQGLGRALLEQALVWAERQGLEVVLTTQVDNRPARRLFEQAGLIPFARKEGELMMVRPLVG